MTVDRTALPFKLVGKGGVGENHLSLTFGCEGGGECRADTSYKAQVAVSNT
jgi:hypothetical protein